jgi:adenylate kinase family enzyme
MGRANRIHVVGASGAGTSTLGQAVATRLGAPFFDTDDFYWRPTAPPYQEPRDVAERVALMGTELNLTDRWVLSGSLCGWGDVFVPMFDLVVFLHAEQSVRLARLRVRERDRYGAEALRPGGAMHGTHEAFMTWAAGYDDGGAETRSRRTHEQWLELLPPACDVIRLDATTVAVADLTDSVSRRCGS